MNKLALLAISSGAVVASTISPALAGPAVRQDAMERSRFYNAPREIQILDERPVVRDFREAPSAVPSFQLPPGPQGGGNVLPQGGLPLGNAGFRTPQSSSPIGLPRADFGHAQSNIPSSLGAPRGLPKGTQTGVMGNLPAPKLGARPAPPMARNPVAAAPVRQAAPQQMMSYGPGYGSAPSVGSANASRSSTNLRGSLLTKVK
jgi:hypothetical protein